MLYFSHLQNAFYDNTIHATLPADAIEITPEQHQTLLAHLNSGGSITVQNGGFVLQAPPPDAYHIWNDDTQAWETNADLQAKKLQDWREHAPEITPKQLRLTLLENGISGAQVETAIAQIEDEITRETAQIEWQYATCYARNNPNLVMIATQLLGLDDAQIDAMWQAALLK